MIILYANKAYKSYLDETIRKGTYILMANYRSLTYIKKFPVEIVTYFEMFWGARRCVILLNRKKMLKWLNDNSLHMKNIRNFVLKHK